ncbi:hypothetical protein mRhiFer1_008659 [Rhinolophus ferrumequinum]|uniref:L1 transposable element RRM domain-containing protein n=1 Tax=Rhinolophus ferrumequinum TaxID=59479 RepID=A0A7J7U133_RHIFE|nr:hypothetical protein mRhiFer1_008659 [Rhinolophus ferrumequinum]
MGKQRNMSQIKQQKKPPELEPHEIEVTNLSETEFRTLMIRMFKELRDDIKRDVEIIMNNQLELKNTITEIKNTLEGITSKLNEAEDHRVSDLEDKLAEITQMEQKEKRIKNNEDGLRVLWDNTRHNNVRIIGIPGGEEREQGIKNIFEVIMSENFPNLVKKTDIQAQKVQFQPG